MYKREIKQFIWKLSVLVNSHLPVYLRRNYQNILLNKLKIFTDIKNKKIMILGFGEGKEIGQFFDYGAKMIVGVEPYPVKKKNLFGEKFKLVKAFGEKLPFADNSFDIVYSIATLEHVRSPISVVKEMMRTLKPGGIFFCQAGPLWNSYDGYHPKKEYPLLNQDWFHLTKSEEEVLKNIHSDEKKYYHQHLDRIYKSKSYNRLDARVYYEACSWLIEKYTPLEISFYFSEGKFKNLTKEKNETNTLMLKKYGYRELVTRSFLWIFKK